MWKIEQWSFVKTKPNISCQIRFWTFWPIHILTKNVWPTLKSLGERQKSVKMQKGLRGGALKKMALAWDNEIRVSLR